MKLEQLTLRGVLAFPEQVTVHFRDLPAGLIAVAGGNYQGKTTLIETPMAGTYRRFPSREKPVLDYTTRPDAFIETTFELEGRGLYRARLNLDKPNRKTDGIVLQILPDGSMRPLNDGKVTTFDQVIRELLPPPELVLASTFAAQNGAGSFRTLDRSKRKDLFGLLLGLAYYEQMAERAKVAFQIVQQQVDKLTQERTILARDTSPEVANALAERDEQLADEYGAAVARRQQLTTQIDALDAEVVTLHDARTAYGLAQNDHYRLTRDLERQQQERQRAIEAVTRYVTARADEHRHIVQRRDAALAQIDRAIENTSTYEQELRAADTALAAVITDAEERIANNRTWLAQEPAVRRAATEIERLDPELTALRGAAVDLRRRLTDLQNRQRDLQVQRAGWQRDREALEKVKADAALVEKVPFGQDCAPCMFMVNATAAAAQLPTLAARVTDGAAVEKDLDEVASQIAAIEVALREHDGSVQRTEQLRQSHAALAKRLPDVEVAAKRIADHEARKVQAETAWNAARDAAVARETERVAAQQQTRINREREFTEELARHDATTEAGRLDLFTRAQDLDALVTEGIPALIAKAEAEMARTQADADRALDVGQRLAVLRRDLDTATADAARINAQHEDLERRLADLHRRETEIAQLDVRLQWLRAQHSQWDNLQRVLGRDGLPLIEIDNAGPTVASYTNDLLHACGFGFLTVELVTQEAKRTAGRDGQTMKDSFELKIYDSRTGGDPRDLTDLSGSEQTIVDECLKAAIALLVNQKNVYPMRTVFRDETTGALDQQHIVNYMAMLRRFHELGGFHQTFYVSHSEDAKQMADAQIVVHQGTIQLRFPPYAEAA